MIERREIRRQVIHLLFGAFFVLFIYFEWLTSWMLFFMLLGAGALSYLSTKFKIPVVYSLIEKLERPYDAKHFPGRGPILMIVGTLLAVQLFPRSIALAAVSILAFGDSVSHLFGARFGKRPSPLSKNGKKLIEGTIAGTIAGSLGALAFVSPLEAFIGALGAMIVESVEIQMNQRPVDDNIVVPLVAGALMLIVRTYLQF